MSMATIELLFRMKLFVVTVCLALNVVASEEISNASLSDYDYNSTNIESTNWEEENTENDLESRIIGGWFEDISEVPYQAGLLIPVTSTFRTVCGASLYSPTRLLSAAHCFVSEKAVIQPIRFPEGDEISDFVDEMAMTSGYGATRPGGSIGEDQRLSAVTLPIISNRDCSRFFRILESNICTAYYTGQGSCKGDSGGPLVVRGDDGSPILVGITSFGHRNCAPGYPTVFTRVTSYLRWIASK
ncbi:chymotrypsin-2-like [Anticarsia gemmatalis]|uniref:chymotrypsin-2-like n=1 Tax=Anticarsia gemmatalis TaxID=129554 RepID=UPI003F7726E2